MFYFTAGVLTGVAGTAAAVVYLAFQPASKWWRK